MLFPTLSRKAALIALTLALFTHPSAFGVEGLGACLVSDRRERTGADVEENLQLVNVLEKSVSDLQAEDRRKALTDEEAAAIKKMEGYSQKIPNDEAFRLYPWQVRRTIRNLSYQIRNLRGSISLSKLDLSQAFTAATQHLQQTLPELTFKLDPESGDPFDAIRSFAYGTHVTDLNQEQAAQVLELWALKKKHDEQFMKEQPNPRIQSQIQTVMSELTASLETPLENDLNKLFKHVMPLGCCNQNCMGCIEEVRLPVKIKTEAAHETS